MKIKIIIAVLLLGAIAVFCYAQPGPIAPLIMRFLDLTDIDEVTYVGEANKYLRVNAGETAIEFGVPAGAGDLLADASVPMTANWDIGNFDITLKSLTGDGSLDFGGGVSTELVNSAAPVTNDTGEIALDITIVDHQPLWQYYDGSENMTIIAIDTAQLPALDNEVVGYDAATDKWILEAPGANHNVASHSDTSATGTELDTLTDNSISDTLHRHTELVASDGTPDPALSVDSVGRVGMGTSAPDGSLEIRTGNSVIRIRDTGDTATATTSFVEFGGTTATNWDRTGYIGDTSSGDTHIRLCAEDSDLILGDSSGVSVLTLSGGDVTATGALEGATLTEGGVAVYNDDEMDAFSELDAIVTDKSLVNLEDGGTFTGGLIANANLSVGNATTTAGVLTLLEDDDDGANFASFMVPALGANTVYTLPPDDGDNTEVLQTNGAGVMTWVANAGGATAWDDIGDPDNSGLITITFDNAEATLITGDNDAAVSFWTIQNSDGDHTVGQMYLLDLDYSADNGDAEADYIKFQDSGSVVMTIQQNGDTVTDGVVTAGGLGTFNANLTIGNTDVTAGVLTLLEDTDAGGNFASFQVPALAGNTVYTLPADDGDNLEILQTNGAGVLDWVVAGAGNMNTAVYDAGVSGGVDQITTVDSTYASDYVVLTGTAVGTDSPKTDAALTYDATSGTLGATQFTGGGAGVTSVDAITGDSATAFFSAGTIEHEYGGLEVDMSVWTGVPFVSGGVTTELDILSELITALTDVTAFITDDDMPAVGTDPDIDAAGEIGRDSDGADETGDSSLRGYDGAAQFSYAQKVKTISIPVNNPDGLTAWAGRANPSQPVWLNSSGMTFTIIEVIAISDVDNYDCTLFESNTQTDVSDENDASIIALECDADGTEGYTDTEVVAHAVEHDHWIIFEDTLGDAGGVTVIIKGWFNADVD